MTYSVLPNCKYHFFFLFAEYLKEFLIQTIYRVRRNRFRATPLAVAIFSAHTRWVGLLVRCAGYCPCNRIISVRLWCLAWCSMRHVCGFSISMPLLLCATAGGGPNTEHKNSSDRDATRIMKTISLSHFFGQITRHPTLCLQIPH